MEAQKPKEREDGHKSPPKEYRERGATKPEHYADPTNFKYPIHGKTKEETYEFVRAAIAYFAKPENHKRYPPAERRFVARRIYNAAKKVGIEVGETLKKLAGIKEKEEKGLRVITLSFHRDPDGTVKAIPSTEVAKARRSSQRPSGTETPLGTRLLQAGRNTVGVQDIGGRVYLVVPKPVIRIGPRGGQITGINPDGTPEYGGVLYQPLNVSSMREVTKEKLTQAINILRAKNPTLTIQEPSKVMRITSTGQLQPFMATPEPIGRKQVKEVIKPVGKPYGGRGKATRRVQPELVHRFLAEQIGIKKEDPATGARQYNWEKLRFFIKGPSGGKELVGFFELVTLQDGRRALRLRTEPVVSEEDYELATQIRKQFGPRGAESVLKAMFALDRSPNLNYDPRSLEIYNIDPTEPVVGRPAARWKYERRGRGETWMNSYTLRHRQVSARQRTQAIGDIFAANPTERIRGDLQRNEPLAVAVALLTEGVDVGTPGHEEVTGHVGVLDLTADDVTIDHANLQATVRYVGQNGIDKSVTVKDPQAVLALANLVQQRRDRLFPEGTYNQLKQYVRAKFGDHIRPRNLRQYGILSYAMETLRSTMGGEGVRPMSRKEFSDTIKSALAQRFAMNPRHAWNLIPPEWREHMYSEARKRGIMKAMTDDDFVQAVVNAVRQRTATWPIIALPDETLEDIFDYAGWEQVFGEPAPDFDEVVADYYGVVG